MKTKKDKDRSAFFEQILALSNCGDTDEMEREVLDEYFHFEKFARDLIDFLFETYEDKEEALVVARRIFNQLSE